VDLPCFGIYEFGQPSPLRALFDDLPGTVPVYSEDQSPAIPYQRAAAFNILFEHVKSVTVDGQDSLASVLLLFSSAFFYLAATLRAESVTRPKARSAHLAGKLDAAFKVLNDYCALGEVYVLNFQG
jgi:hypothetical protein